MRLEKYHLLWFCIWLPASTVLAGDDIKLEDFMIYSTQQSIGIEWKVIGDDNHNATNVVMYRESGGQWQPGFRLSRVDYRCKWSGCDSTLRVNMLAGSLLFLKSNTEYEIKLEVSDPDGGGIEKNAIIQTKPFPRRFSDYILVSDIDSAQRAARKGDVFKVISGSYKTVIFNVPDIVWLAGEDVTIEHAIVQADNIWLEGFNFNTKGGWKTFGVSIGNGGNPNQRGKKVVAKNITLIGNKFHNYHHAVVVGGPNWYINGNTITGNSNEYETRSDYTGIGVHMWHSTVISENDISMVGDAISIHWGNIDEKARNIDIYHNHLHDLGDDGLELDGGWANIRVWDNKIIRTGTYGISFQPQKAGPWYIISNYVEGWEYGGALKLMAVDQFVLVNNTFIQHGKENDNLVDVAVIRNAHHMAKAYSRGNRYVYDGEPRAKRLNSYIWHSGKVNTWKSDWRTDHDGDVFIFNSGNPRILERSWNLNR